MKLDDTFYLGRSGRYATPKNTGDLLPLPYGDLTDGTSGIWGLPCIDTVNHVYCYSDSEVLSAVNGNNDINIYADGALVTSGYTFDPANNYESKGVIATITFTTDQANKAITARGKGICNGATLLTNIIDIADHVLTVRNDFAVADYDPTAKAKAHSLFATQGYQAAGVITADVKFWDLLQQMLASFLGDVYQSEDGLLVFQIDDGTVRTVAADLFPMAEIEAGEPEQLLENVINRCPCEFGYNYTTSEFGHFTDDSDDADAASQVFFGVRRPAETYQFHWCRDAVSISTVQAIIVAKFRNPLWIRSWTDQSLQRMHLGIGDAAIVSFPDLIDPGDGQPMINQYFKILRKTPDYEADTIAFEGLQTSAYMKKYRKFDGTHAFDGTHKHSGSRDMTIY